jgi:hypothetical protein
MADLIDRISGASAQMDPPRPKLNLHRFIAVETAEIEPPERAVKAPARRKTKRRTAK